MNFIAYIAGFFDGEGSLGVYRQNTKESQNSFFLKVAIGQKKSKNSDLLLKKIKSKFGGKEYLCKNNKGTVIWKWQIDREKSLPFLEAIYPFLTIKKPQVREAIKWQKRRIKLKIKLKPGPVPKKMSASYKAAIADGRKIEKLLKRLKN